MPLKRTEQTQDPTPTDAVLRRVKFSPWTKPFVASILTATLLAGCASENALANPESISSSINESGVEAFLTTGWDLQQEILSPFEDRIHADPTTTNLDDQGIAVYKHYQTGEELYHPIYIAQHAMALILDYQTTGDPASLDFAAKNAQHLIDNHTEFEGAWFFQYEFDWTYVDRTLVAPWWSGMAQGEALTVFSRLAQLQPENPQWRHAADQVFKSFAIRGTGNAHPWSTVIIDGELWFEEYAGSQPPLQVLNGQVFAIFGLWEYWVLSADPEAARLIDGGATTVLTIMPRIRNAGNVSYYCAQLDYCESPDWVNGTYHPIHIQQLDALSRITGDQRFTSWSELLVQDTHPDDIASS